MTKLPLGAMNIKSPLIETNSPSEGLLNDDNTERAITIATMTNKPYEESLSRLNNGDESLIYETNAEFIKRNDPVEEINRGFERGEDPALVAENIALQNRKNQNFSNADDVYMEQLLTSDDPRYSEVAANYLTNSNLLQSMVEKRLGEVREESSTVGLVIDFLDRYLIRQTLHGNLEDITSRSTRLSEEVLEKSLLLSPPEFKRWAEDWVEEAASEGYFTDENFFALEKALKEATAAGFDPDDTFDKVLALVDVTAIGAGAIKGLKAGLKASTPLKKVAAVKGSDAGGDASEKIIAQSTTPRGEEIADAGPAALDPDVLADIRPSGSRVSVLMEENQIVKTLQENTRKNVFGRALTDDEFQALKASTLENFRNRSVSVLREFDFNYDVGNTIVARAQFGTTKLGKAFVSEKSAQKLINQRKIDNAKVVPDKSGDGFVIEISERVKQAGAIEELSDNFTGLGPVRGLYARMLGSNAINDDAVANALALQAEGAQAAVVKQAEFFLKELNKLPRASKQAISNIYTELRDGTDAGLRAGYTPSEFADKFEQLTSTKPTTADLDGYNALVSLEDAAWFIKADKILNRYVEAGYQAVLSGKNYIPARPVDASVLKADDVVFDGVTNREVPTLKDDQQLWQLRDEGDGVRYIVRPVEVKMLDHEDVLGFNAGGSRINPDANYFMVIGEGKENRAIMTAFTEKQAKLAETQLNVLFSKIDEAGGVDNIKGSAEFDELVQRNNDWNPNIETASDLAEHIVKNKWDVTKRVAFKGRDEQVVGSGGDFLFDGDSWDNYVPASMSRSDTVLEDFGGGKTNNIDSVNAIVKSYGSAIYSYPMQAYTNRALNQFVRSAIKYGAKYDKSISRSNVRGVFDSIQIEGRTKGANELRRLQGVIQRRLSVKSDLELSMSRFGDRMREFIFDTTKLKLPEFSVENKLLTLGFHSAFGFLNPAQFIMQAFHMTTITAISPRSGFKGASMVAPLRALLHASPKLEDALIKNMSKSFDLSTDDLKELVEYVRTSGRAIVDHDAVELGTPAAYNMTGFRGTPNIAYETAQNVANVGNKVLQAGLIPFKEGEKLSRLTGMATAFLEYKKLNPAKGSALTNDGRRWLSTREQALTFNMTTQSRAGIQSGLLKVPTQWLSYTLRAMETVFVGRNFTAAERARAALVLGPMFGMNGLGFAFAADYLAEKMGIEAGSNEFIGLKYGFIDYFVSQAGTQTAIGDRLSPVAGILDLYRGFRDDPLLETALGPSGAITGGFLDAFMETSSNILHGHEVALDESAIRIMNGVTSLNNYRKGLGVIQNGVYVSKSGKEAPFKMKTADGVLMLTGFSPAKITELNQRKGEQYRFDKEFKAFRKELLIDRDAAFRMLNSSEDDDINRGLQLLKELEVKIRLSGMSMYDQNRLSRSLLSEKNDEVRRLIENLYKRDRSYAGLSVERIVLDEEE